MTDTSCRVGLCFFFNDTATTEIYTLSLHDALPISATAAWSRATISPTACPARKTPWRGGSMGRGAWICPSPTRSEEHTSELQSQSNIVCRLLLEKKKQTEEYPHDLHARGTRESKAV